MGHFVLLCIGTNINQTENMQRARQKLSAMLSHIVLSRTLWTEPIGIASDKFLNCLAKGYTPLPLPTLQRLLKETERELGSTKEEHKSGEVKIDIDILLFDDARFHLDDWERDYIKTLLKDFENGDIT